MKFTSFQLAGGPDSGRQAADMGPEPMTGEARGGETCGPSLELGWGAGTPGLRPGSSKNTPEGGFSASGGAAEEVSRVAVPPAGWSVAQGRWGTTLEPSAGRFPS